MPCSGCGQSGHNVRTCSGQVTYAREPERIAACSGCGRSGHNIRSCHTQSTSSYYSDRVAVTCSGCGHPGHNIRTCPKQLTSTGDSENKVTCSGCGKSGHNVRTCQRPLLSAEGSDKKMTCSNCGHAGHNTRTCPKQSFTAEESENKGACSGCGKSGHNIRTCGKQSISNEGPAAEAKSAKSKKENQVNKEDEEDAINYLLQQLNKSITKPKKNLIPPISVTSTKPTSISRPESPKAQATASAVNTKPSSTRKLPTNSYIRDTDQVIKRLEKGPTETDGPGYIYIYKIAKSPTSSLKPGKNNPDIEIIEDIFKIGMTERLPERRMAESESKNQEKYFLLHSEPVAWRGLIEKISHYQLSDRNYPRELADGGSEWFQGNWRKMKDVILDAKKIVETKYGDEGALGLIQNY